MGLDQSEDFIPSNVGFTADKLGFDEETESVTLYVEALTPSTEVRGDKLVIEVDFDGDGSAADYAAVQSVDFTIMDLQLVQVNEDNTTVPIDSYETSFPSPVIDVTSLKLNSVQAVDNNEDLSGSLNFSGAITFAICDYAKGEDGGTIDEVRVYVNGSEDPVRPLRPTSRKALTRPPSTSPTPTKGISPRPSTFLWCQEPTSSASR